MQPGKNTTVPNYEKLNETLRSSLKEKYENDMLPRGALNDEGH